MSGTKPVKNLYFIAILSNPEIAESVTAFKHEMRDRFGAKHALKVPPHFTLQMPFRALPDQESEIVARLSAFAASRKPFLLHLNGFGAFPPRVIFVKPENPEPVRALHEALKPVLRKLPGVNPEKIPHQINPHCTIATRDLTEEMFPEAWESFRTRSFAASFCAESLHLLKHNGKFWETYMEFPFSAGSDENFWA
ncbi:MAG: 2'-5' RNA ligase family protein [Candidatus Cyclonatronum sp.]|uniref:2'-5' RNA ligase family protein n=1 Tax=Cyclonatronum sp. TaxID=3024185 RepID=UPI0025B8259B|nr:2'-5' RNA ligase family protein [Cyclonatronum sp.]MCH8487016.1 2'-5' RNA ligase family protein [Cyclonatronum sp.]